MLLISLTFPHESHFSPSHAVIFFMYAILCKTLNPGPLNTFIYPLAVSHCPSYPLLLPLSCAEGCWVVVRTYRLFVELRKRFPHLTERRRQKSNVNTIGCRRRIEIPDLTAGAGKSWSDYNIRTLCVKTTLNTNVKLTNKNERLWFIFTTGIN